MKYILLFFLLASVGAKGQTTQAVNWDALNAVQRFELLRKLSASPESKYDTIQVWMLVSDVNGECFGNCGLAMQLKAWYVSKWVPTLMAPPFRRKANTGFWQPNSYLLSDKRTRFTSSVIWQVRESAW